MSESVTSFLIQTIYHPSVATLSTVIEHEQLKMLHTLHAKNFTLFSEASFEFSPGLNVVIGDNGTGKSLLLKLAYALEYVLHHTLQDSLHDTPLSIEALDLSRKLKNVFQPDKLNRLCRSGDAELLMSSSFLGQPAPDLTIALSILSNENQINIQQSPSFFLLR